MMSCGGLSWNRRLMEWLAARIGNKPGAVARLEAGSVGVTLTTLQRVAAAFDLTITIGLSLADRPSTEPFRRNT
jgi:transcriptional regulator with XRE-family HTH domain